MKKIRTIMLSIAATLGVTTLLAAPPAYAAITCSNAADCASQGQKKVGGDTNTTTLEEQIKTITNILLFVIGAIAVIAIIIGGIRYVTSNGDSGATKSAKDTVLYAVIGLVVAILAFAIVNFVVTAFQ